MTRNSLSTLSEFSINGKTYHYYALNKIGSDLTLEKLPFASKILLENLLRNEDEVNVTQADILAVAHRDEDAPQITFSPSRVVLQDFTGVPAVVDLAAMRDALAELGGDPQKINPQVPVDLVIDHSVMVDHFGSPDSLEKNTTLEFERNRERYNFLRWGQQAFDHFRVVPPGTGIVHQVNLEYLADVVSLREQNGKTFACPDTLVGTDSHTTMINGLGVLGWGVGGIEAEAAMLGQPVTMVLPEVVGFHLSGELPAGTTATDLVLTVTQMLRKHGVVGKFVEFYGPGVGQLSLADRATIANMAPEYGATVGIFPVDDKTLDYLRLTGRSEEQLQLVEHYCKLQGLWREDHLEPDYSDTLALDLATVVACIAGPKRPQDRIPLDQAKPAFSDYRNASRELKLQPEPTTTEADFAGEGGPAEGEPHTQHRSHSVSVEYNGQSFELDDGAVVIAAITSCTNTSNPSVMIAAGLMAQNARARGLTTKPWVKTSLAPGSQVVPAYLQAAGLDGDLAALGFDVVGFGCTTCIGNSGPLPEPIQKAIVSGDLLACSVLSGNRNFEGRIHADVKANFLASPPLVVAYALAGSLNIDLTREPLGSDPQGEPVYLTDLWPSAETVNDVLAKCINRDMFSSRYSDVFKGTELWQALPASSGSTYDWPGSTYIRNPPYFKGMSNDLAPAKLIKDARCLVKVGDSITTDHISPAGAIQPDSPAGQYLQAQGVSVKDFNSLGSRRGNHEVMMRGTFANVRLQNQLAPGRSGGYTRLLPDGEVTSIYQAAMAYKEQEVPLIVLAGKEYGTGSSRDWAAKGTRLLGVEAVIAESFERIHRSNLVGFGVLPLQYADDLNAEKLGLTGEEEFSFGEVISQESKTVEVIARLDSGEETRFLVDVRIDTPTEWRYYENGGILHAVLRQLAQ